MIAQAVLSLVQPGDTILLDAGTTTFGAKAFQFLDDLHVDTVFLGVSAITDELILCSHSFEKADLKRAMLKCGTRNVLLADASKFGCSAFARICPLSELDLLITDQPLNERDHIYLATNKVELLQVKAPR